MTSGLSILKCLRNCTVTVVLINGFYFSIFQLFINVFFFRLNMSRVSQLVTLHFDSKPISVLCHMGDFGCGDGAWTPVMKIDGSKVWYLLISSCIASSLVLSPSAIRVQALARDIALCSWSHSASLHPDIRIDTRNLNVGSNSAMD